MKQTVHLLVDTANILFRVASSNSKHQFASSPEDQAGLAMHSALLTMRSYYNKVKPDKMAISFEGGKNWRKDHTRDLRDIKSVSKRLYKGNRVKDDSMIPFFELIAAFEHLAREHTALICLAHDKVEGDDMIAAYARKFSALGDKVVIVSADKDFIQLMRLPGVTVMNPDANGQDRTIDKKTGEKIDPVFFMYEKAFRGDSGDNVMSAFPRVRTDKLKKAFDAKEAGDTFLHSNLMNSTWTFVNPEDGAERLMRVGDLYEENLMLMDLVYGQPQDIQEIMATAVDDALATHGKFDFFQFQKFCGKFKLNKISEQATNFVPMLAGTGFANSEAAAALPATVKLKKKISPLVF
jgi:hypothetical protein